MTPTTTPLEIEASLPGVLAAPVSGRVVSLDIFRGLTMALMIFVNDLASVHGLSKWTYHMPTDVDAMSYVDAVFPAFLFIVGMSLPLAVRERLKHNPSLPALWRHIALRVIALLVLGLILANGDEGSSLLMHGIRPSMWTILALLGGVLVWGAFGRRKQRTARRLRWQHGIGLVMLVACFAVYRRLAPDGHAAWIAFAYPEILGLIGMAYLSGCILYVPFRRSRLMPVVWLVLLLAFDAACMAHVISIAHLPIYVWPFDNGSMPAIVMAGIGANTVFFDKTLAWSEQTRLQIGVGASILAGIFGGLMVPFGISKNRGTPTWSLWSIAACLLVFCLLYWLCDKRGYTKWAAPFRSAGSNTLLTYLLPDFYVYTAVLFGFSHALLRWNYGAPGVVRAALFTCAMLALSTVLTQAHLRMQL
jgi:heparan-alpha-glucosaminide N-acetyltransferase